MSENKLASEKSLYLKQHAENPVHWLPYGQQALNKARELNKLIFVSIGYSSCHWCHVMAHESFEDETTAKYLNEHFISIKVDREEYPDLDHYYQTACGALSGRGGWPLNVFLTPEGKVFFAGTYFPKIGRQGMPSFVDVLKNLEGQYKTHPKEIIANAEKLAEEIRKPNAVEKKIEFPGHFPGPSSIVNALKGYADEKNGGYGKAPKFPHFPYFEWACEQILEGMIPQEQGQHIVNSVEKMMMGGMYDHLKGGIHRYSTDDRFIVPHFEKMLYDQAGLLRVLSKMGQFYPSPLIFDGILQTLDYLKTEMIADENYFFSAQDADSEGMEGLYFTFSKEEFEGSFEEAPAQQRARIDHYTKMFNITDKGNFEQGLNVISLNPELKSEYYSQEGWQEVREIQRRLLEQRKMRMPPATDRKGVAAWNYMLLSALTDVVQYCPVDAIKAEAFKLIQQTAEGCLKQFLSSGDSGRHVLRHVNTLEKQALYLEDYVNFSEAQLRLYELTGNAIFKKNALESLDFILEQFVKEGEVYITSAQESTPGIENLRAPFYDQSYRSSTMALVLLLNRASVFDAKFTPESVFGTRFENFAQLALHNPLGHGEALRALTYPGQIYRRVEVPATWIEKPEFQQLRSHFFSRFVMDYHEKADESFQICTRDACEVSKSGLTEFLNLFTAKESDA